MHPFRLTLILIGFAAPSLFGVSKEMVQLQRDVTLIQEQLRLLQSTLDTKLTELKVLSQQALDESKSANTAVTVLDRGIAGKLAEQQKMVAAPVAGVGAKMDQLANDFSTLREAILELSSRMNKMQTEMREVKDAVATLKAPPPPPAAPSAEVIPPPQQLYDKAQSDRTAGNVELALKQFQDFVTHYPTEPLAANAQFYIGNIHYDRSDFDSAISAFDQVLERYPDNIKTPDASYMKGLALLRSGQKASARKMFEDVVTKYPNSDVAPKARTQLNALKATSASVPMRKKTRR
jgi:tol-pal system protein YbgF